MEHPVCFHMKLQFVYSQIPLIIIEIKRKIICFYQCPVKYSYVLIPSVIVWLGKLRWILPIPFSSRSQVAFIFGYQSRHNPFRYYGDTFLFPPTVRSISLPSLSQRTSRHSRWCPYLIPLYMDVQLIFIAHEYIIFGGDLPVKENFMYGFRNARQVCNLCHEWMIQFKINKLKG